MGRDVQSSTATLDGTPIRWLKLKAMRAAAPALSRLPAVALKPGFAMLLARGHDDASVAKESLGIHSRPYDEHGGGAAMARQVTALDVQDTLAVQDRLPTLGVPAPIVWGVADPFQRLEYGERFARDLGTTVRRIEGGKHFTPEDHPDVVAEETPGKVSGRHVGAQARSPV